LPAAVVTSTPPVSARVAGDAVSLQELEGRLPESTGVADDGL
jgi:hypothetical protein